MIKACIFDLDGVIVDTAKYHYLAWKRLANELGFDFGEEKNEQLKGVSRTKSLEIILGWGNITLPEEKKVELAARKNEWYREYILKMEPDEILEGVIPFFKELEEKGIKIGMGSGSKNAQTVVERIGLVDTFEVIVDGTKLTRGKPDPQVFELGAEAMEVKPEETIVFEDAESGIAAALNGGFYAVGVGDEEILGKAHLVISGFKGLSADEVLNKIAKA